MWFEDYVSGMWQVTMCEFDRACKGCGGVGAVDIDEGVEGLVIVFGIEYFWGFFFGRIVMYCCVSHSTSMANTWGGGCRVSIMG